MAIRDLPLSLPEQQDARRYCLRLRAMCASITSVLLLFFAHSKSRLHGSVLHRAAQMPLTLAGYGCIDFAAFHVVHGLGWLVTGISLMILEFQLADDQ